MRDKRPDFLSSHPSTPQRVEFAERAARQFGAPGVGVVDRERYLAGIDEMVFGDDPSQGFVRERTFVHPKLGIGFSVPEGFVIDNTSDAVLATGVDGTALRFDAVGLAQGTDLAEYLPRAGSTASTRRASPASRSTACRRRRRSRGQGLALPDRRHPGRRRRDLPLHLRQRGAQSGVRQAAQQTVDSFRSCRAARSRR
jgi:hypothetical protein